MLILMYVAPTNVVLFITQKQTCTTILFAVPDTDCCMCSHELKTVLCAYTINTHLGFRL